MTHREPIDDRHRKDLLEKIAMNMHAIAISTRLIAEYKDELEYGRIVADDVPFVPSPSLQRHIAEKNVIISTISELLGVRDVGPSAFSACWQSKHLLPALLPGSIHEQTRNLFGVYGYACEVVRLLLVYRVINIL